MSKDVKQVLQVASVYVGTVIGAGFASGQEMIQFFTSYGMKGIGGLILAGILYVVVGVAILEIVYEKKYLTYRSFMNDIMGEKLARVLEIFVNLFLFVCFSTMIAGAGAIIKQEFNVSIQVGTSIMAIVCILTFFTGAKGLVKMNSILVPIICIGGVLLGTYIIIFRDQAVFASAIPKIKGEWVLSAVLYVSYNTLTVVVVLSSLYHQLGRRKVARWSGIVGGLTLGILGLSIGLTTFIYYSKINTLEIPMLGVLLNYPDVMKYLYMIILLIAMYTTAIANGYGVIENITNSMGLKKKWIIISMTILGFLGAQIGFSQLVGNIFPLFGYIGVFEIIMIMVYYGCMRMEHRRKGRGYR